jgi:hypothetical protein
MDTFEFKITLDSYNAIQNLNYYDLPEPPRFSLPSTFNRKFCLLYLHTKRKIQINPSTNLKPALKKHEPCILYPELMNKSVKHILQ